MTSGLAGHSASDGRRGVEQPESWTSELRPGLRIAGWIVTALMVLGWALLFRPQAIGGPASYISVSGISMTPTMHTGDLALVERRSNYHVGDIVTYRVPAGRLGAGTQIIHRIVGGDPQTGFIMKGDHNGWNDMWHPTQKDLVGKVWFWVPGGANRLATLRRPVPLAAFVGVIAFGLVAWPSKRKQKVVEPAQHVVERIVSGA